MSFYYLILWNQMDILQKHFQNDHVHVRLWTRFYGNPLGVLARHHFIERHDSFKTQCADRDTFH